jgi:hypothetical protein
MEQVRMGRDPTGLSRREIVRERVDAVRSGQR